MDLTELERWVPDVAINYEDGRPAVGLGLIITLFFRDGHTPQVREKLVDCIDRFYTEFKPQLKKHMTKRWGGITEKGYAKRRQEILESTLEEIMDWYLSSAPENYLAPEYAISFVSERVFHNDNSRSVVKLTFPWDFLAQPKGAERYQDWLLWLCNTLDVESGYAGLSPSLPMEFHRLFPCEYALAQRFSGLMVDSIGILEGGDAVEGVKGACWYTVLGTPWLDKLGGAPTVSQALQDTPDISVLSYNQGLILKAGEQPTLGEMATEGLPPLLVKVNQLIRPVRQDGHNSLHFYSMEEDFQFDKTSSMKWFARFDAASDALTPAAIPPEPVRITGWSMEICPHSGRWSTFMDRGLEYVQLKQGQELPAWYNDQGQIYCVQWTLLERDDGGTVHIETV